MGKNKVLQIGLGRTAEDEADDNLHKVSEQLVGERGLLFTDESIEDLLEFFNSYSMKTHSRAGSKAPLTVTLEAGLLNQFTFSQEPYLRKLGLNTQLAQQGAGVGVPKLRKAHTVCKKGARLRPKQAKLLKLLGYEEARYHVRLYGVWERESKAFKTFGLSGGKMVLRGEDEDEEEDVEDMTDSEPEEEGEEEEEDEFAGIGSDMMMPVAMEE